MAVDRNATRCGSDDYVGKGSSLYTGPSCHHRETAGRLAERRTDRAAVEKVRVPITFETSVRIGRLIEDVLAFVSDPLQFPRWNSAVHSVHNTSGRTSGVGSTYSM